jgi:hypothetical protein
MGLGVDIRISKQEPQPPEKCRERTRKKANPESRNTIREREHKQFACRPAMPWRGLRENHREVFLAQSDPETQRWRKLNRSIGFRKFRGRVGLALLISQPRGIMENTRCFSFRLPERIPIQ